MDHDWHPLGARDFVYRSSQLRRSERGGLVKTARRAYKGVIIRRGEDGKAEYGSCPHAHAKRGVAKKCAEKEARLRNRMAKKEGE